MMVTVRGMWPLLLAGLLGLIACTSRELVGGEPPCITEPRWVRSRSGGMGPAVLLCAPDGGAAPGACDGIDLGLRQRICDADGGAGYAFYRLPDGGIGGGWPEPGDPDGPPGDDWRPVTGVRSCPDGWRSTEKGVCDPVRRVDCPSGGRALPGGGCIAVECEPGDWPTAPNTAIHVRIGADDSAADGSAEHPYGTLARAVRAAGHDGTVVLADGTYPSGLLLRDSVAIIGRCPSRVTLTDGASTPSLLEATGNKQTLTLRGVTLRGSRQGVYTHNGSRLVIENVVIEQARTFGVVCVGTDTTTSLHNVVIQNIETPIGATSASIAAKDGCRVEGHQVVAVASGMVGIEASTGGSVSLQDSTVEGPDEPTLQRFQLGAAVIGHGSLTLDRSVVRHIRGFGVTASSRESQEKHITLRDVVIQDGIAYADRGGALYVAAGTTVEAERVAVERQVASLTGAILIDGEGTTAQFRDVTLRGVSAISSTSTAGLYVSARARASVSGLLVADVEGHGILIDQGAGLNGERVLVSNTHIAVGSPQESAYGIQVWGDGSQIELTQCTLEDTVGMGLVVGMGVRSASLNRCTLRNVSSIRGWSTAVMAWGGGHLVLSQIHASNSGGLIAVGRSL